MEVNFKDGIGWNDDKNGEVCLLVLSQEREK